MENTNGTHGAFACASSKVHQYGLSKREYFAAIAMQAMVARGLSSSGWTESDSKQSVYIADALINELNKQ